MRLLIIIIAIGMFVILRDFTTYEKYSTANLSITNNIITVEEINYFYDLKGNFKKTEKELKSMDKNGLGNIDITSENIVRIANKNYDGSFGADEYIYIIQFQNYEKAKEFYS